MTPLILASASPRRRELLASFGLNFDVVVTDGEDRRDAVPDMIVQALPQFPLALDDHPTLLAWRKAQAAHEHRPNTTILAADTIVVINQTVLNKPRDVDHAHQLLRQLAGQWHRVYTGLVVIAPQFDAPLFDLVSADVRLMPLTDQQISEYIATGEPMDKAGAYGVQGVGGALVQEVQGSFTTVVGLPLPATATALTQAAIELPRSVAEAWHHWRKTLVKEPLCMQQSKC